MSKNTESDDEFHDALTEPSGSKINEDIVEEIIRQSDDLNINEDDDGGDEKETTRNNEGAEIQAGPAEADDDFVDVEMLKSAEKDMTEEELIENKEKADKMKLEANELFKNDEALAAINLYSEALLICPTRYSKERAILYGNRAAAKIKLGSCKSAIYDCTHAIDLYPEYVRALLR